MANNWRQQAKKLVGQQVVVRDTKGQTHHGILQQIKNEGIQIRPIGGAGMAAAKRNDAQIGQAIATDHEGVEAEETFFLGAFLIAWALIAGLWAWGAYGGYGGYGYPYGGYGYGAPYARRGFYGRGYPGYGPGRYW